MTPSAILYAAADYMREHGFSVKLGWPGCPRCFVGTLESARNDDWCDGYAALCKVVDTRDARLLRRHGWNTRDAVAALTIAADIAFEDERARG